MKQYVTTTPYRKTMFRTIGFVCYALLLMAVPLGLWAADMYQSLDLHGNSVTNAKYYGDAGGLTNVPPITETDPVWTSEKSGYATGTPVYAESDPVWKGASNLYYRKTQADSTFATGTPVYVESDPVWTDSSNQYYRKTEVNSTFATGTPVYVESDPVWTSASNLYLKTSTAASTYLKRTGGTITGPITNNATIHMSSTGLIFGANISLGDGSRAYSTLSGSVAIGAEATARYREAGVAIGREADGDYNGVAVGAFADGQYSNIAIGFRSSAYSGYDRITIGRSITNRRNNTCAIRGTLYLDGGTGVVYRSTVGSGAWTPKAFTIDHPLDPENMVLRHYCVEGPEVWDIYSGNTQIIDGYAVVDLPEYYDALNLVGSEVYNLTAVGGFADLCIAEKVSNNRFVIAGSADVGVSWTVKVLRNDPATVEGLKLRPVEQKKSELQPGQSIMENMTGNANAASK